MQPHQENVSSIDPGLSQTVMDSSRLIMTENYVDGNISETTITAEKNSVSKHQSTDLWPQHGYFKHQHADFSLQKANMPEMTLTYLNQGSTIYKNDQKICYGHYFILGQVMPLADSPFDLSSCELKSNEVKILRPKYNLSDGQFLGLVETLGYLIV